MSAADRLAKLEGLLERIRRNAAQPRPPRASPRREASTLDEAWIADDAPAAIPAAPTAAPAVAHGAQGAARDEAHPPISLDPEPTSPSVEAAGAPASSRIPRDAAPPPLTDELVEGGREDERPDSGVLTPVSQRVPAQRVEEPPAPLEPPRDVVSLPPDELLSEPPGPIAPLLAAPVPAAAPLPAAADEPSPPPRIELSIEPPPPPVVVPAPLGPVPPLTVTVSADVVRRPQPGAVQVPAFVAAARRPAPATFGELLDASLELGG